MAQVVGKVSSKTRLSDQLAAEDTQEIWEQQEQQQKAIEQECAEQPLIGEKEPIFVLHTEYSDEASADFLTKSKELSTRFSHIRKVRGDGNCFYRAVLFSHLERCLGHQKEMDKFQETAKGWLPRLLTLGFPEFTTTDFCEQFLAALEELKSGESKETLEEKFNSEGESNYLVVFARLVTSGFLQEKAEEFQGFIEGERTVKEFCQTEVDPMFKECDHLCIIALTSGLDIPIRVEYMDRSSAPGGMLHHDFAPEGQTPNLNFLYRPGHYDILYTL